MSPQRARKKPVEVDVVRVADALHTASRSWADLPKWLVDAYHRVEVLFLTDCVKIKTLEGTMTGLLDDWIIKGVQGELYPCKNDIFLATYDIVEE